MIVHNSKQVRCVNHIEEVCRDNQARADNMKAYLKGGFVYLLTLTLPLAMFLSLVQESILVDLLGKEGLELLKFSISPVKIFWAGIPSDSSALGCSWWSSPWGW